MTRILVAVVLVVAVCAVTPSPPARQARSAPTVGPSTPEKLGPPPGPPPSTAPAAVVVEAALPRVEIEIAPPSATTPPVSEPANPTGAYCGGVYPPCWVVQRESGWSATAVNPTSGASGMYQFIPSTWAGYGGYASAADAPPEVQAAKAADLWAGGAGCAHWQAC